MLYISNHIFFPWSLNFEKVGFNLSFSLSTSLFHFIHLFARWKKWHFFTMYCAFHQCKYPEPFHTVNFEFYFVLYYYCHIFILLIFAWYVFVHWLIFNTSMSLDIRSASYVQLCFDFFLLYSLCVHMSIYKIYHLLFILFLPPNTAFHNPGCILCSCRSLSKNNASALLQNLREGQWYQYFFKDVY